MRVGMNTMPTVSFNIQSNQPKIVTWRCAWSDWGRNCFCQTSTLLWREKFSSAADAAKSHSESILAESQNATQGHIVRLSKSASCVIQGQLTPKPNGLSVTSSGQRFTRLGGFLFLVLVCWMLTQTTPSRNWILNVRQVSLKDSMKLFAKRYPKASGQVTSMREMQAWVHQYMNHIDQVNLCGDQL